MFLRAIVVLAIVAAFCIGASIPPRIPIQIPVVYVAAHSI
jgi:hypothetical protein